MSASEPNRPELTPNREEFGFAPTQALRPDEPSSQLAALLDDYLAELQAGRHPDRAKLLAEHPELATQLEQCLSGIEFIHRASAPAAKSGMPTQLGDFRIVREVGRGGMGVVYEAEQISLKRRVALKVLRFGAASDTEAMQRFQREAETVAGLHHTNIVPIFAIGCEQGVNYYAMQFIEGRSLNVAVSNVAVSLRETNAERRSTSDAQSTVEQSAMSTPRSANVSRSDTATEIAGWGLQAAEALAHAHHRGVIHRDIKPSNLILDPDGRIWLTDFGLAKRMDDVSLSIAGTVLGTPRYMSPEQAAASKNPVDHRTDIYSLGATLYELATGRPLFEADSPHAVITQILTAEPPRPRVVCPSLPCDFETIILKCLSKEPAQRYATAQALADDLRAFVEGRAIRARRATLVEQAARWFKQQKRSVGVAAATVAATIFVMIGSLIAWQMHSQAQLGYLTLESPRDDSLRAEVAQVMTLDDEPVGSPFTLPTKEPVALPEGAYRLRLTAPSKVSQDYLFDVAAGQQIKFDVGLANETVGYALPLKSPVGVEVVRRSPVAPRQESRTSADANRANDAQPTSNVNSAPGSPVAERQGYVPRLFIGPQDLSKPTMRCFAANAQPGWKPDGTRESEIAPLFAADWRLEAPGIVSFLKLPEDKEAWKVLPAQTDVFAWQQVLAWFDPSWFRSGTPPQVMQLARDLNGDGVEDAIWIAPRLSHPQNNAFGPGPLAPKAAVLVAASGKDGQPLWWFRPQDSAGGSSVLRRDPIWVGESLVCVLRSANSEEIWIEAVAPQTGESLWRSDKGTAFAPGANITIRTSGGFEQKWPTAELTAATIDQKPVVIAVIGNMLMVLDAATGKPQRATHVLPSYAYSARFETLDDEPLPEALLTFMDEKGGPQLAVMSVARGERLWDAKVGIDSWQFQQTMFSLPWPFVSDLDDDGLPEVIVPSDGESGDQAWMGCRAIDGKTGKARWERRFPIRKRYASHIHRPADQYTVGPDLDGDGQRELFMASIRREYGPRMVGQIAAHHYEEYFLYVDAFSGRDGRSVWWQRVPLGFTEYAAMTGTIGEMLWWGSHARQSVGEMTDAHNSADAPRPGERGYEGLSLVIPIHRHPDSRDDGGTHSIYVLSAATGRVEHQADDLAFPQLVDWNNDGLDDLAVFVPDDPVRFEDRHNFPLVMTGKFVVLRGSPPEAFRRLDRWVEEQDFDGDGIAELSQRMGGRGVDYAVQIASGRDGRITSHWKIEWPETPRSWTVGELHSFPSPLGDFDGDGLADLLVSRISQISDFDAKSVVARGQVPLLVQAISGRTGRRIWGGGSLPLPDWIRPTDVNENSGAWHVFSSGRFQPTLTEAVDLDGDGRGDVLHLFSLWNDTQSKDKRGSRDHRRQLFAALLDGRNGTLRWAEPYQDQTASESWLLGADGARQVDASADLNGDDTRDIVLVVPKRDHQLGTWTGLLQAQSGRDGKTLWGPIALSGQWINDAEIKRPIINDLDGDGRPEIVLLESKQPMVVKVLRGDTGESLWTWNGALPPNFVDPSVVIVQSSPVAPRQESRTSSDVDHASDTTTINDANSAPGNSSRGSRRLRCVAVSINETGNQWVLVLLDHAGQVVERVPYNSNQLWSHDLDGDGGEELLRYEGTKLTATRGLHDVLWTWTRPATDYGSISRFDRTPDGRVIVVTVGSDSITLLDGPTGEPIGRSFKSTNTSLQENNRMLDLNHAVIAKPFENSRLLTRVGDGHPLLDHVVSLAVLPTDADGRYQSSPVAPRPESRTGTDSQVSTLASKSFDRSANLSRSDRATLSDPRLVRQLPWAPSQAEWTAGKGQMLKQAGLAVGLAFVVVLVPFWLIRAGVRRKELGWWRGALIVAGVIVFAGSLMLFRFAPPGAIWRDVPWALPIALGAAALPGLAWIAMLLRNLFAGEWRRLTWLLGGSLLAALALAAFILSLTDSQKPPEQHYSWHAWWFILLFGAHAVGALLVVWKLFGPGVLWLWKFGKRRFTRHA